MKRLAPLFLILALFAGGMNGCASTPEGNYATVQDLFIVGVTVLVEARDRGQIDPETWEEDILPFINAGDKALDAYYLALTTSGDTAPALAAVRDALVALEPFITKYSR